MHGIWQTILCETIVSDRLRGRLLLLRISYRRRLDFLEFLSYTLTTCSSTTRLLISSLMTPEKWSIGKYTGLAIILQRLAISLTGKRQEVPTPHMDKLKRSWLLYIEAGTFWVLQMSSRTTLPKSVSSVHCWGQLMPGQDYHVEFDNDLGFLGRRHNTNDPVALTLFYKEYGKTCPLPGQDVRPEKRCVEMPGVPEAFLLVSKSCQRVHLLRVEPFSPVLTGGTVTKYENSSLKSSPLCTAFMVSRPRTSVLVRYFPLVTSKERK